MPLPLPNLTTPEAALLRTNGRVEQERVGSIQWI